MDKRVWLAGLVLGLLLSASGCGKVEHCSEGSEGCQGGGCIDDKTCKFDLTCVVSGKGEDICGIKQSDGSYDCGKTDCYGPGECNCSDPEEVCVPGIPDMCLNYCTPPEHFTENPVNVCRAAMGDAALTPDEACETLCRHECNAARVYCGVKCDPEDCASTKSLTACKHKFGLTGDDADTSAVSDACEAVRDASCRTFQCPAGSSAKCNQDFVCTNNCRYHDDGQCDDGDLLNGYSAVCDWGSDCGDCGPRVGSAPATTVAMGGLCPGAQGDAVCAGHTDDLDTNQSWCWPVEGVTESVPAGALYAYRCVPDCSQGRDCGDGYKCEKFSFTDQDNMKQTAGACSPQMCK
jgi:hypothetical protein